MNLSIVVPTIPARRNWLRRMLRSVDRTAPDAQVIVVRGHSACGDAWNEGIDRANRDRVWFAADDFQLTRPGWWQEPLRIVDSGRIPAPLILHTDGTVQSCGNSWQTLEEDGTATTYSRAPMIRREWWPLVGPMPTGMHYFTDHLISTRAANHGIPTVVCRSFTFKHHLAEQGRYGDTVFHRDQQTYGAVA